MDDRRWSDLAGILVNYSTRVQPDDHVLIVMQEPESLPLATAVYEAAIRAGGFPHVQFRSTAMDLSLLREGTEEQIAWISEPERTAMEWADVCIVLRGAPAAEAFAGIPPTRIANYRRALGVVSGLRTALTRWCLCRVPGEAWARTAGLALDEAMALFWSATLRDWPAAASEWSRYRDTLAAGETVRILAPGTDLTFSTRGRRWVVGDGHINMPDGEIYTAPLDGTMEGSIAFTWPATFGGQACESVRLEFRTGVVSVASADTNESLLQKALAMDEGASSPGEVGIGVNEGITQQTGDVLFDEKIAGTLHLALGRAYAECEGTNVSALHWDFVTDLRTHGEIRIDGRAIFRNGAWTT